MLHSTPRKYLYGVDAHHASSILSLPFASLSFSLSLSFPFDAPPSSPRRASPPPTCRLAQAPPCAISPPIRCRTANSTTGRRKPGQHSTRGRGATPMRCASRDLRQPIGARVSGKRGRRAQKLRGRNAPHCHKHGVARLNYRSLASFLLRQAKGIICLVWVLETIFFWYAVAMSIDFSFSVSPVTGQLVWASGRSFIQL